MVAVSQKDDVVKAITVRDRGAGVGGLPLTDMPYPHADVFFVVEPDRSRLVELAQWLRDGRLKPIVGAVRPLAEAPAAFAPDRRIRGKTIIRIAEGG